MAVVLPRTIPAVSRTRVETLQVNLGRLCNQACRHCHVDSSPARGGIHENAQRPMAARVLEVLRRNRGIRTLDLTGGAPELNPWFRLLAAGARGLGRRVLVRHNLTVQFEAGQEGLPDFFAGHGLVLFCSLPCYKPENVERQRGRGVFERSLDALRRLNAAGYGAPDGGLELNLVFNPAGPSLPPQEAVLEEAYHRELGTRFGIRFTRLVALANQPIHRFREDLERSGRLEDYYRLLESSFNAETLSGLMCRSAVSVRWDGRLYDCDFNLVLDLPLRGTHGRPLTVDDLLAGEGAAGLEHLPIATARHCFACTAGAGSSCGGALAC